jgi:hypothetical protein
MHRSELDERGMYYGLGGDVAHILSRLETIMSKLDEALAAVADLTTKVDTLQADIDADQAGDALVVRDLQAANDAQKVEIQRLTDLLGTTVTDAQLQTVIDGLTAVSAKVDAAAGDVSGPNA